MIFSVFFLKKVYNSLDKFFIRLGRKKYDSRVTEINPELSIMIFSNPQYIIPTCFMVWKIFFKCYFL